MKNSYKIMASPVGDLLLMANEKSLTALTWKNEIAGNDLPPAVQNKNHPILKQTEKELKEYFSGKRKKFTVPFTLEGTEFQIKTWKALTQIPFGKTWSYGQQAKAVGKPKAVRAIGGTNGRNPIAIIVPCHRVIGANGSLTGYGGGLKNKKYLLELEKAI